jgi:DNA-binding NarL/FixJ family response regulator
MKAHSLSVFITDDDPMFRLAMQQNIQANLGKRVILQLFKTGEEMLLQMRYKPDLIFLDYNLNSTNPTASSGLHIIKKLIVQFPEQEIYIMSAQTDFNQALAALNNGAKGYILKDADGFKKLNRIIEEALQNKVIKKSISQDRLIDILLWVIPFLMLGILFSIFVTF